LATIPPPIEWDFRGIEAKSLRLALTYERLRSCQDGKHKVNLILDLKVPDWLAEDQLIRYRDGLERDSVPDEFIKRLYGDLMGALRTCASADYPHPCAHEREENCFQLRRRAILASHSILDIAPVAPERV
jgi:hypothetical protein